MDAIPVGLSINSTKCIMTMDKTFIKDIKKLLGYLMGTNDTTADRLNCGLLTMQVIDFLAKVV